MQPSGNSRDSCRWMLALGALLAAVLFGYPLLLGMALMDPDEGLHASIAQEMVERGDWLTPHFLGEPFLDKPILYFWAKALALRVCGMHEAGVRLPGLLFGLLGMVTTAAVGWRLFGRSVGLLGGVFYATMILPTAMAQAASHDVALVPWVNLSLLGFWESERATGWRAKAGWVGAIGGLLGLACLTKGLAGVALVGVAYGGYVLLTGRLTLAACLRGAAALVIAAAVASIWYVPVELRNPGYLRYYFVERHLLGYVSNTQWHGGEPWWYYLPVLLGGGLPWIAYLPVAVQDAWARYVATRGATTEGLATRLRQLPGRLAAGCRRDGSREATVLLCCWLIGCTLFLSASSSKLVTYLWPVFPAAALLASRVWVRLIEGTLTEPARRSALLTFWLSCLGGAALPPVAMLVVQTKLDARFTWPVWLTTVLLGTSAWAALWFIHRGRYRATLTIGTLSVAAQYMAIMVVVMPPVAAATSARDLAGHFNRVGQLPPHMLIVDERLGSLVFYLKPELRAGLRRGQIEGIPLHQWGETAPSEPGTVVALPEAEIGQASRTVDIGDVPYERAGRYRLYDAGRLATPTLTASADGGPARR